MNNLSKKFFVSNRQALAKASAAKLIVVAANGAMQKANSTKYRFQQDSNFFYLTGVNEPNIILVIDVDGGRDFFIAAPQTEVGEIFDGSANQAVMAKVSGVPKLYSNEEGWSELANLIAKHKLVHTIEAPESYIDVYSMYTNPARAALIKKLKKHGAKVKKIGKVLGDLRTIKQPEEVDAIRQAIEVTKIAIYHIANNIADYKYEYEIEADVEAIFRRHTQYDPAYDSIIASGKNACTLHYMENSNLIDKTRPLLMDVGAQFNHYAADITRVLLPKNNRAREVHDAVEELQEIAYKIIKPGVDFIDYERSMAEHYGQTLVNLGVIKKSTNQLIRKYMPHATSHFLGLDVHDAGDYYQEFKPGMVITVEPGLYLPKESIGIRIEDDILITNTGVEVLSSSIPTKLSLS